MNRHVIGVFEDEAPDSLREFDGAAESACTVHGTDTDLDETGQQTLDGSTETCDECGREPEHDLETVGDRELCIVCRDREEETGVSA